MATTYTEISESDVRDELEKRGYRFNFDRQYAIQLTVADPVRRFKDTKQPYRNLLGGVNHVQMAQILRYSESAVEAADQIEAISTGKLLVPTVGARQSASAQPMPQDLVETIAANRAQSIAADRLREAEAQLQAKMAELDAKLAALDAPAKEAPKKRGRPRGSTNRSKETVLTPDQEEMLKGLRLGPTA